MGTTAEKLSYLNETKTQIKNALETPYNVFRDYPAMIKKYIDNQPTKTATDGVCENAVELPVVSLKSDGNSEQKTTEGRQLFNKDNPDFSATGSNAKYVSIKNGFKIVCNKNETTYSGSTFKIRLGSINDFIGTLRIKTTATVSGNGTFRPGLVLFYGNANNFNDGGKVAERDGNYGGITNFDIESNITEQSDFTHLYLVVYGNSSGSAEHYMNDGDYTIYDNFIITLNNEDMTYEQYTGGIPSPNPDYKQDIEVIDGCNIFNGNFTTNGIWKDDGTINYTIQSKLYWRTDFVKIPNKNIFFSDNKLNIFSSAKLLEFDADKKYITSNKIYQVNSNLNKVSLNENTKFIAIQWDLQNEAEIESLFTEFQITEGTTQKPYLPHGAIGLEQSGKNKFDNRVQSQLSNNAKETTLDENKRITLTQATYSYAVFKIKQNVSDYAGKVVRLKVDFTKSNSNLNPKYGVLLGDANYSQGRQLMGESTVSGYTINFNLPSTFENGKEYLYVRLYATVDKEGNIDDYVDFNNIILTIDNEDMTYEPYHEPKIIPIDLQGNTLAKVGDVKDNPIIHRNGEVEIEKKVGKYVFTGEELWNQSSYGEKSWILPVSYISAEKTNSTINVISNIFNGVSSDDRSKELKNKIYTDSSSGAIVIRDTQLTTLEDVRVATKNNYMYYKLITPQTIKLPSIEPIELWQGTNIFELITNLETDFEVEYVVDKDSVLDEVQTAMLNAEIEI